MNNPMYYNNSRLELLNKFTKGRNRVLEIGCAEGLFGEYLKQHGFAEEVIGIELFPDAANVAQTRLDKVICGDIEVMDHTGISLAPNSFDYIVCADVLEHLRDPWVIVSWLETLLNGEGRLIVSIPNIRHWSVVFPLLFKGEWTYRTQGILDQTHLRFFTRKSAMDLIQRTGLKIESCAPLMYRKLDKEISRITFGGLAEFTALQWLISARKNSNKVVSGDYQ